MKRVLSLSVLLSLSLCVAGSALAFPTYLSAIPNGTFNSCNTCHKTTSPASWNSFGDDVGANLVGNTPDWGALCPLDSDADGATNGAELGDPTCTWVIGDSNPPGDVYHPGDDTSTPPLDAGDPDEGDDTTDEGDDTTDEGDDTTDEGEDTTDTDDEGDAGSDEGDEGADGSDPDGSDPDVGDEVLDEGDPGRQDEGADDEDPGADSERVDDDAGAPGEESSDEAGAESTDWRAEEGGCQGGGGAPLSLAFLVGGVALIGRRTLAL